MTKLTHALLAASIALAMSHTGCAIDTSDEAPDIEDAPGVEESHVILPGRFEPPKPPSADSCLARNEDTWEGAPYTDANGRVCVDTYGEHCVRSASGICQCQDILVSVKCGDPPPKDPPIKLQW